MLFITEVFWKQRRPYFLHQVKVLCFISDPTNTGGRLFTAGLRLREYLIPGDPWDINSTWQKIAVKMFRNQPMVTRENVTRELSSPAKCKNLDIWETQENSIEKGNNTDQLPVVCWCHDALQKGIKKTSVFNKQTNRYEACRTEVFFSGWNNNLCLLRW